MVDKIVWNREPPKTGGENRLPDGESTINYPWIITERTFGTAADRIRRLDVDCSFTITREIVIGAGFKRSPGVEVDDDG